jgi:hypothetical protein
MLPDSVKISDAMHGVQSFNRRYAEMERALWCLSNAARGYLLRAERSGVIEELVWTIKSWWGVQGVKKRIKSIATDALVKLEWNAELFSGSPPLLVDGEKFAIERVSELVEDMRLLGSPRSDWSLASKILHWLLPWRIPVYDSFVKKSLGISSGRDPREAYSDIVRWEFGVARKLMKEDSRWLGDVEPRSPFRALDKYLWWLGGGDSERALVVSDPWRIVNKLGLRPRQ